MNRAAVKTALPQIATTGRPTQQMKAQVLRLFLLKFSHVGTHGRASLRQHIHKNAYFLSKNWGT